MPPHKNPITPYGKTRIFHYRNVIMANIMANAPWLSLSSNIQYNAWISQITNLKYHYYHQNCINKSPKNHQPYNITVSIYHTPVSCNIKISLCNVTLLAWCDVAMCHYSEQHKNKPSQFCLSHLETTKSSTNRFV